MHCLYFICERKFDARKNYATLEINLKGKGDKDDGLTPSKNGLGLSEQTACVIVQVFFKIPGGVQAGVWRFGVENLLLNLATVGIS